MRKEALIHVTFDMFKDKLEKDPNLISVMYQTLPSNTGLTLKEFLELKNEYAPTYVPTRTESDNAILNHALQSDVYKTLLRHGTPAIVNFIEKLQYILTQNVSDTARKEATDLITRLTFADTK